jgi:DNA-directed RNA polymerase subunit RPC12/RpoP
VGLKKMKILKCVICGGEVDIINDDRSINKKIKCRKCGFTNFSAKENKEPEIFVIKKRKS